MMLVSDSEGYMMIYNNYIAKGQSQQIEPTKLSLPYLVQERHRLFVNPHRERVLPSEPLGCFPHWAPDFGSVSESFPGLLQSQQVFRVLFWVSGSVEFFEAVEQMEAFELVRCPLYDALGDFLNFLLEHCLCV